MLLLLLLLLSTVQGEEYGFSIIILKIQLFESIPKKIAFSPQRGICQQKMLLQTTFWGKKIN
jgi:hypothetical protein